MRNMKSNVMIVVKILTNGYSLKNSVVKFKKSGKLFKSKTHGMYEWFVGDEKYKGESLGSALFDCVGSKVAIGIRFLED